ncbi:recombinase family protein [Babesia caballi]|uniref:Recombinase family protein n=1 Tax=Babesia caballi TaxID=5871 RepID=A0AAV4LPE4_BABCB|nr:recombinase family protein [Babesia caballi]
MNASRFLRAFVTSEAHSPGQAPLGDALLAALKELDREVERRLRQLLNDPVGEVVGGGRRRRDRDAARVPDQLRCYRVRVRDQVPPHVPGRPGVKQPVRVRGHRAAHDEQQVREGAGLLHRDLPVGGGVANGAAGDRLNPREALDQPLLDELAVVQAEGRLRGVEQLGPRRVVEPVHVFNGLDDGGHAGRLARRADGLHCTQCTAAARRLPCFLCPINTICLERRRGRARAAVERHIRHVGVATVLADVVDGRRGGRAHLRVVADVPAARRLAVPAHEVVVARRGGRARVEDGPVERVVELADAQVLVDADVLHHLARAPGGGVRVLAGAPHLAAQHHDQVRRRRRNDVPRVGAAVSVALRAVVLVAAAQRLDLAEVVEHGLDARQTHQREGEVHRDLAVVAQALAVQALDAPDHHSREDAPPEPERAVERLQHVAQDLRDVLLLGVAAPRRWQELVPGDGVKGPFPPLQQLPEHLLVDGHRRLAVGQLHEALHEAAIARVAQIADPARRLQHRPDVRLGGGWSAPGSVALLQGWLVPLHLVVPAVCIRVRGLLRDRDETAHVFLHALVAREADPGEYRGGPRPELAPNARQRLAEDARAEGVVQVTQREQAVGVGVAAAARPDEVALPEEGAQTRQDQRGAVHAQRRHRRVLDEHDGLQEGALGQDGGGAPAGADAQRVLQQPHGAGGEARAGRAFAYRVVGELVVDHKGAGHEAADGAARRGHWPRQDAKQAPQVEHIVLPQVPRDDGVHHRVQHVVLALVHHVDDLRQLHAHLAVPGDHEREQLEHQLPAALEIA